MMERKTDMVNLVLANIWLKSKLDNVDNASHYEQGAGDMKLLQKVALVDTYDHSGNSAISWLEASH